MDSVFSVTGRDKDKISLECILHKRSQSFLGAKVALSPADALVGIGEPNSWDLKVNGL